MPVDAENCSKRSSPGSSSSSWVGHRCRRRLTVPCGLDQTVRAADDCRRALEATHEPHPPRAGPSDPGPHRGRRRPPHPGTRRERLQHGRAGQGGRRRPRHRLRALPLEARGARRARVVDRPHRDDGREPHRHQRSARRPARHARRGVPALGRARGAHERAAHAHRHHRRRPGAAKASTTSSSARLVEALSAAGQMRAHWTVDEATDALGALTSYATYERLRRAPRTPEQVEAVLAKLVVSIVSRGAPVATSRRTVGVAAAVPRPTARSRSARDDEVDEAELVARGPERRAHAHPDARVLGLERRASPR